MILRTFACALLATAFMGAFSVEVSLAEAGYHFFGGKRVSLPFKAPVKPCEKIRVQLYTATGSMEAPIGEPVVNDCSKPLQIDLPVVRVKTKLNLEIESSNPKGWDSVGSISLQAYPLQILSPLREWAQDNDLLVADSDGKLEAFFEKEKIPFVVHHSKVMKSPAVYVVAGHGEILFEEEAEGIPKIVIQGKSIHVEMLYLDQLATNPLFQYELLKMFQEIL